MEHVKPFSLSVPQAELDDLRSRLERIRWPSEETSPGLEQGMPLTFAMDLARYWLEDYDWRRCERELNQWEQFTTEIDGIDIHFFHIKSPHASAKPLILSHGWPGSCLEFHKVIDPLINPTEHGGHEEDAFHLVIPSLPGFAFSGKPTEKGVDIERIAEYWAVLMERLGYGHYYAQGGDWGAMVTESLAQTDPQHCAGIHLNFLVAIPNLEEIGEYTADEQAWLMQLQAFENEETAYSKIQGTRPQTVAFGFADSPIAQMAWIVEKFLLWSDCEEPKTQSLLKLVSADELLDTVMLYWLNNAGASSARLYWESYPRLALPEVSTPTGFSVFPADLPNPGRRIMAKRFKNISYWNELPRGGHFAALEQPTVFVDELRACFADMS